MRQPPVELTTSLTSMVPTYGSTVTDEDGSGEILIVGANVTAGDGGATITPAELVHTSATGLMMRDMGGSKLMPVTEKSLLPPQVAHSCSDGGNCSVAFSRRPFCRVQSFGSVQQSQRHLVRGRFRLLHEQIGGQRPLPPRAPGLLLGHLKGAI